MKHIYVLLLLFLSAVTTGCEKAIVDDDNSGSSTSEVITDEMKRNALTVPQAIATEGGTKVTIKGYIVAAAENSIKKSDFHAPFEGSTALVLAARKSNGSSDQFDYSELIPICLTDAAKGLRDTYNLEENNQYWNQFVYISGTRKEYMSVPGIKKVQALFIDTSHVPTADEKADSGGSEEHGSEQGEGGDTPDIDYDTEIINGEPVYTIAQALANKEILDQNVFIKGYIVASAKRSMGSMDFEKPFDSSSAIILSDIQVTSDNIEWFHENQEKLMPVVFNANFPEAKANANLKDNPENWNRLVYVFGNFGSTNIGQPGISPAVAVQFPHQE